MCDIEEFEAVVMLDLPDGERYRIARCIEELERGFAALEQISTEGVEPLVTVLDATNIMRDDIARKLFTRDEILENAPEQYDGFFKVPGTI